MLALLPYSTFARATSKDPWAELAQARLKATSAIVIALPEEALYPYVLTEADVIRMGCAYKVARSTDLPGLFAILDRAGLSATDEQREFVSLRISVVLKEGDVVLTKLLFEGDSRRDDRVHGVVNGVAVTAGDRLPAELRSWVAQMTPFRKHKLVPCPT